MPASEQYEVELSDGRVVTLEADHKPSEQEVSAALNDEERTAREQLPKTSGLGALGRGAGKAIVPGLVGAGSWALGAALAPVSGGASFLIPLGTSILGTTMAAKLQDKAIEAVAPDAPKLEAADLEQHPILSRVGGLAGAAATFEVNPLQSVKGIAALPAVFRGTASAAQRQAAQVAALQTGIGAAQGVISPLIEGQKPTVGGVVESAANALLFGKPRWKALLPHSMAAAGQTVKEAGNAGEAIESAEASGELPVAQPEETQAGEKPAARVSLPRARVMRNEDGSYNVSLGEHEVTVMGGVVEAKAMADRMERGQGESAKRAEGTEGTKETQEAGTPSGDEYEKLEREAIAAAEKVGAKAEIVDKIEGEGDQPFAGRIATVTGDGRIQIQRGELRDWLENVPPERRSQAIDSLISEEHIHTKVGDAEALDYWNNLTGLEKGLVRQRYAGKFASRFSETQLGHEAIRGRLQQLARMTPTEVAGTVGRERWTSQFIYGLEQVLARIRAALGTEASKTQQAILARIQNNLAAAKAVVSGKDPFAFNKRKAEAEAKEQRGTGEMFPGMTALGQIGADKPPMEAREIPREALSATALPKDAEQYLAGKSGPAKAGMPSREDFVGALQSKYGPNVQPGQVQEVWAEAVWKYLSEAPGETIKGLRKQLRLGRAVGQTKEVTERDVPEPIQPRSREELRKLVKEAQSGGLAAKIKVKEARELEGRAQRYRNKVISAIAQKLIGEPSMAKAKPLARAEVTPEDLGWWRGTPHRVWQDIGPQEASNIDLLTKVLNDGARAGETTKVSETLALVALRDRTSGQVHLVSTHPDPRRGQLVTDPRAPSKLKPQVPVEELLSKYQPIYKGLLDEPVKDFHKRYANIEEFNRAFAKEANETRRNEADRTEAYIKAAGLEPTAGVRGEGGDFTGPEADVTRGALGLGRGLVKAPAPLTDAEAGAIWDSGGAVAGNLETPASVEAHLNSLAEQAARKTVNWQLVAGYQKVFDSIRKGNRELTPHQALEKLYEEISSKAKSTEGDRDGFIDAILGAHGPDIGDVRGRQVAPVERRAGSEAAIERRIAQAPESGYREETVKPGTLGPGPVESEESYRPTEYKPSAELEARGIQILPGARGERPGGGPKKGKSDAKRRTPDAARVQMPAAFNKAKAAAEEQFAKSKAQYVALVTRRGEHQNVYKSMDGIEGSGRLAARIAGEHIRVQAKDPKIRTAAIAMNAAYFVRQNGSVSYDLGKVTNFIKMAEIGIHKGENWETSRNPIRRYFGKRWREASEKLKAGAEYALAHSKNVELLNTATALRQAMKETFDFENANGLSVTEKDNYLAGYYEGEFFDDKVIRFGSMRILGTQYRKPSRFQNYFEAIAQGPYIPASLDVADIAQSRIAKGRYLVNRKVWLDGFKAIKDPESGLPIGLEPKANYRTVTDPVTGLSEPEFNGYQSPDPEHELVYPAPGAKPIAIRVGFKSAVQGALAQSSLRDWPVTREMLWATQLLKHGWFLTFDTFHPGRLLEYGAAAMSGRKIKGPGFKGGYSALTYAEADLPAAVAKGYIRPKDMAWALQPLDRPFAVKDRKGLTQQIENRRDLAEYLVEQGMNAVGSADALWKDAVQHLPGLGKPWHKIISPINRWIFDKFTPGLMAQTAVTNFEKYAAKYKGDLSALARDVATDTNALYGNMGRQGIFKNPNFRDFAQIFMLAPVWQEGLLQKEVRFASRLAGVGLRAANQAGVLPDKYVPRQGLPALGLIGETMGKGLLAWFIGTQIMNLASRGKLTWDNEEKGHKLDAAIKIGDETIWLSPMAVFAEVAHDLIRLGETEPTVWERIEKIGENKLGPIGRLALVLGKGKNAKGEKITSTMGYAKEAAGQIAVMPISAGLPLKALGHALAPGLVGPVSAGQASQRLLSTIGIKANLGKSNERQMNQLADEFMRREGLKKETGWMQVQTDEPSYSKLRLALRQGDTAEATRQLAELRKQRNDGVIIRGMKLWARAPFTRNQKAERLFLSSLSNEELGRYSQAQLEKEKVLEAFYAVLMKE